MQTRRLVTRRRRHAALAAAALAIAATVSACASAHRGAPVGEQQDAGVTAPGRSFDFAGMEFSLTGKIDYETNLPQCPQPEPVLRIPAGLVAEVDVVPKYTANCPAQPWVLAVAPRYPAGYLGEVDLLSGYDGASFYVRIAKPYARPIPALPAGSFEATVPASAATFVAPTEAVVLFWDSATNAILLVTGPHSTTLAEEVASSLHPI